MVYLRHLEWLNDKNIIADVVGHL